MPVPGHVDRTHSAFPEPVRNIEVGDAAANHRVAALAADHRRLPYRTVQQTLTRLREQRVDFPAHRRVARAGRAQKSLALTGVLLQGFVVELLNSLKTLRIHVAY
jgi:hypothetical protein